MNQDEMDDLIIKFNSNLSSKRVVKIMPRSGENSKSNVQKNVEKPGSGKSRNSKSKYNDKYKLNKRGFSSYELK